MNGALESPGVLANADRLIALRRTGGGALRSGVSVLPGGFAVRRRGAGLDLAGIRAYAPGDDLRHLDRSATARTGTPHVRTFHAERDRLTMLVADLRPSMLWGMRRAFRSVAAVEALTRLGWQAVDAGGRVGLYVFGGDVQEGLPFRGRETSMLSVIGVLVRTQRRVLRRAVAAGVETDPPLDAALVPVARLAPRGTSVVIASGFDTPGEAIGNRLAEIGRGRDLTCIEIGGAAMLPPGRYRARSGQIRETLEVRRGHAAANSALPVWAGWPGTSIDPDAPTTGEEARWTVR